MRYGDPLAQLVEHNTFNVGVLGSSPKRITLGEQGKVQKIAASAVNKGVNEKFNERWKITKHNKIHHKLGKCFPIVSPGVK